MDEKKFPQGLNGSAERAEEDREKQEDGIGRLLQKTRENEIRR